MVTPLGLLKQVVMFGTCSFSSVVVGVHSSLEALTLPGVSTASDSCVTDITGGINSFDEFGAIGMFVCSGVGRSPNILLKSRCRK